MKCPNCKIDLTPAVRAVMPTQIPVKLNVEVCPQCGFQDYTEAHRAEGSGKIMSTCCPTMAKMLRLGCQEHGWDCPDVIVQRQDDGSFIIPIHDGGESGIEIRHCPWCGTVLSTLTA